MKKQLKSNKGVFLLEVLMAITILSTSLAVIIYALTASYRAQIISRQYNEALWIIEDAINRFYGESSFNLVSSDDNKYKIALDIKNSQNSEIVQANWKVSFDRSFKNSQLHLTSYKLQTGEQHE